MDAHCHLFTDAHLDAGNFGGAPRPAAYSLREHLDGLLSAHPEGEIVVVNAAYSLLPTSAHVIDSFAELARLQTLYGRRYRRVKCVLGTIRADDPDADELLKNPLVIGARCFVKGAAADEVAQMVKKAPFEALRRENKYIEFLATSISTLSAAVDLVPSDVSVMLDHLGAWNAPAMPEYRALLAKLAARTGSVMLKGPGTRTSAQVATVAPYVAAAVEVLGEAQVVLDCTDAPHVGLMNPTDASFVGAAVSGPTTFVHQLKMQTRAILQRDCALSSDNAILKGCVPAAPQGMIHAQQPDWYWGEDVFLPVGASEMMHSVLVRPWNSYPDGSQVLASGAATKGGKKLCVIVGSGYTGWVALYPIMIAQELSRRGITVLALEYPPYGRSTGRGVHEINIAQQADDYVAAAAYARDVLGFDVVVGASWAMGSASLSTAVAKQGTTGGFDGVCLLNALLDAKILHESVIASVNSTRAELEQKIAARGIQEDVELPPKTYAEFKSMVDQMDPNALYPPFRGYPLDSKTTQVVIDELYAHEGYKLPPVRGSFWQELSNVSFGSTKLPCPALLVHGAENELHNPSNIQQFAQTNGVTPLLLAGVKHNDFMHFGHPRFSEMVAAITEFATGICAKADRGQLKAQGASATLPHQRRTQMLLAHLAVATAGNENTSGKENFDNTYDAPDILPYIREMIRVGYEIGDHTAIISRRALNVLPAEKHTILELCAGYGLSMAPILSTADSHPFMFEWYSSPDRSSDPVVSRRQDKAFFAKAARPEAPGIRVVAQDVAAQALEYGLEAGLYHSLIPRNLETDQPTTSEAAAMAPVGLCVATGAFSYISVKTLQRCYSCFDSAPLFLFFPLIATPMDAIADFLKAKGLQVYYHPDKHWLPQRRYSNPDEQKKIEGTVRAKLGDVPRPQSAKDGYVHSVPFIAAPMSIDLKTVVPLLLGKEYA